MPRRFDLLILDLDGTLVDSEAILVRLINETLIAHGLAPADPRVVGASIGLPLDDVFRRVAPRADLDAIDALCRRYRLQADAPDFVRLFRLYAGVAPTLSQLRQAGLRLVIATSKRRATTLDILRHCAIDRLIDGVIGGDCVTHGKPNPEMVHRARSLFVAPVARTLVVGDTRFDIEMGRAAGIATCAVTYGMHPAHELRALRPDFIIHGFESVQDVVLDGRAANPLQPTPGESQ
jgi:phosphoglycolate phosphatase